MLPPETSHIFNKHSHAHKQRLSFDLDCPGVCAQADGQVHGPSETRGEFLLQEQNPITDTIRFKKKRTDTAVISQHTELVLTIYHHRFNYYLISCHFLYS